MNIDRSAPVTAESSATVSASAEIVWDLLVDVNRWPDWNPAISSTSLPGQGEPGETFRWKSGPARLTSVIQVADRPAEIGWTGRTMGMSAVHVWRLHPVEGGTSIHTEESWDGIPARLAPKLMRSSLQKTLDDWIAVLQRAAEARSAGD